MFTDTSLAHYGLPAKVFAAFFLSCKLFETIRAYELPLDGSEPPRVTDTKHHGSGPPEKPCFHVRDSNGRYMGLRSYLTVVVFHRVSEPATLVLKRERRDLADCCFVSLALHETHL